MTTICHALIKKTAEEIAAEVYEDAAHDNAFFAEWPRRRTFVRKNWTIYVDAARKALIRILHGEYPEAMKQPIYEALIIDGSMKKARDPVH